MAKMSRLLVRSVFLLVFVLSAASLFSQKPELRKHSFSAQIGNTTLIPKTASYLHKFSSESYGTSYIEDFEIHNETSIINPSFGASYNRRVFKKTGSRHSGTSYLMLSYDLNYSSITYNTTKIGVYHNYGCWSQYSFDGTVNEGHTKQFISQGLGAKYYYVPKGGGVFGFAVGFNRNHSIRSSYSAEFYNTLDDKSWSQQPYQESGSQGSWKQKVNFRIKSPFDHFSCNFMLSAGHSIGNHHHLGVYVQYFASEHLLYSTKSRAGSQEFLHTSNTNNLNNFHLLNYGIYLMY